MSNFDRTVWETDKDWQNKVILPLGSAYERARNTYLKKLTDQENADRAAAERQAMLVMLALSLAGGSVLATMFGNASAKLVAADLAKSQLLELTVKKGWSELSALSPGLIRTRGQTSSWASFGTRHNR